MIYNQEKNITIKTDPEIAGKMELSDKDFKQFYKKFRDLKENTNILIREIDDVKITVTKMILTN